jgi:signal transduction histidine kinase
LKHNLQKKIFSSVFIIMTLIIFLITALVIVFEQNRFAQKELKAGQSKVIYEAFVGKTSSKESPDRLKKHLIFLTAEIMGTAFFILIATLGLTFLVLRKNLKSLDSFYGQLSCQSGKDEIKTLKEQVEDDVCTIKKLNEELLQHSKERKDIESRLLNVQKLEAIGTLAGGIAHEFNNLFMSITGYASIIQKGSEPGHPNAIKAEKIRDLVDTGARSINQLLGFARGGKYKPGPLNINEVLRMNLDIFKKSRKDLLIDTSFTQSTWNIYADRSQMEQVIMNLILNASESMKENGEISIKTNNIEIEEKKIRIDKIVSGKFVHLSIEDEGTGIKPEHIQQIFDPFFTTKSISAGTGLGLAAVFGIVDHHDGFITVESNVGKGTVFDVFIPALKPEKENE